MGLERFHGRPHPLHQAASVETERERKRGLPAPLSFSVNAMDTRKIRKEYEDLGTRCHSIFLCKSQCSHS